MSVSHELHVVVLAAGEGKRMHSAQPKVLLPIAGRPMLAHVLDTARALNPAAIHIVHGHRGDALQAAFVDQTDLRWVHQAVQSGTGHAVGLALPQVPDSARVLVLYGDVPLIRLATLETLVCAPTRLAALTAYLDDPHGYGRVICDDDQRVLRVVEERDATAEERRVRMVNTGVLSAQAAALRAWLQQVRPDNAQGECYLTDVYALAAADNASALAVPCADPTEAFGANDAWQLALLERQYQTRRVRELCRAGLRCADPARLEIRGEVRIGSDVEVDVDVILEGRVQLGDGVRIGPYTRIRDSELAAGTEVLAHCDIDGARSVGACRIGPYARLRPGTELAADSHIGNFVETKQVRIGRGSKANHLSYLGDANIGSHVNIGAGTITCNYDGASKHLTLIEDRVFVGSNASLVAPVVIGADATIGAGSVITKDAPAGELTVARPRQITARGWKRPERRTRTD